jgi:hypothetical protein
MARTPMLDSLQRLSAEVASERPEKARLTRRQLLKTSAGHRGGRGRPLCPGCGRGGRRRPYRRGRCRVGGIDRGLFIA